MSSGDKTHYIAIPTEGSSSSSSPVSPDSYESSRRYLSKWDRIVSTLFSRCSKVVLGLTLVGCTVLYIVRDPSSPTGLHHKALSAIPPLPSTGELASMFTFPALAEHDIFGVPLSKPDCAVANRKTPKIIDLILLSYELEVLEIRLNELENVVDKFVIVESETTFTGIAKPLTYNENKHLFTRMEHKIVHIILPPITNEDHLDAVQRYGENWAVEYNSRDRSMAILMHEQHLEEGDWVMLSDLDEIPRPTVLQAMKDQDPNTDLGEMFRDRPASEGGRDLFKLICRFYYYSYEFHHEGGDWAGPVVLRYRTPESLKTHTLVQEGDKDAVKNEKNYITEMAAESWKYAGEMMRAARNTDSAFHVDNAGWHCTWCFSNITMVSKKVESYSHWEHNQEKFKTRAWILDRFSKGLDLFERGGENYEHFENNQDVPGYIARNRDKFSYLLNRWGRPDAGFTDVDPTNPLELSPAELEAAAK